MTRTLKAAGHDNDTLDLVPEIVDTYRLCRMWATPSNRSIPSARVVIGFNKEVEGDVIFFNWKGDEHKFMHLVCRGVRWQACMGVETRTTPDLLEALDLWVGIFGPMEILIFDGETSLDDDEATLYFQMKGITKRTSAVGQHVRIADRRIQMLRDLLHKVLTQLDLDGIKVPFKRVLAECIFVGNAMVSLHGVTPYNAVLGMQPPLLPPIEAIMADDAVNMPDLLRGTYRIREIAVQAIT
jgi:hypothetical protein